MIWKTKGINRNILECKVVYDLSTEENAEEVLIETYWNVKTGLSGHLTVQKLVLIETYWNVKQYQVSHDCKWHNSINRNILECKGSYSSVTSSPIPVLIETYWNVKEQLLVDLKKRIQRINRNILECKDSTAYSTHNPQNGINRNILECKDWS